MCVCASESVSAAVCVLQHVIRWRVFQVSGEPAPGHGEALPAALPAGLRGHALQRLEPLSVHLPSRYPPLRPPPPHTEPVAFHRDLPHALQVPLLADTIWIRI